MSVEEKLIKVGSAFIKGLSKEISNKNDRDREKREAEEEEENTNFFSSSNWSDKD